MIGKLTGNVLEALLETIPVDFSVIDENDKVLAWNKHETRIFKRPEAVIGRDVRNCHPKKSLDKVETILSEMKKGVSTLSLIFLPNRQENLCNLECGLSTLGIKRSFGLILR